MKPLASHPQRARLNAIRCSVLPIVIIIDIIQIIDIISHTRGRTSV